MIGPMMKAPIAMRWMLDVLCGGGAMDGEQHHAASGHEEDAEEERKRSVDPGGRSGG